MKTYKIIQVIPLKNTLVILDPDDGSIQYYKLHSQDKASDYKINETVTV